MPSASRRGGARLIDECVQHSGASGFYFIIGAMQAARRHILPLFKLLVFRTDVRNPVYSIPEKSPLRAGDSKSHHIRESPSVQCEQVFESRCKEPAVITALTHRVLIWHRVAGCMCVQPAYHLCIVRTSIHSNITFCILR